MPHKEPGAKRASDAAYRAAHRAERRASGAAYYAAHREERRAYYASYRAARSRADQRPDRAANNANQSARLAGAPGRITAADVRAVWAVGRCHYCGGDGIGLDHVMPLSRGGANEPANLVQCCGDCNSRKGARTPGEWRAATA